MAREDITVKFNLDDSGFKGGIKRAKGAINGFGKSALGAANKLAKMGLAAGAASLALFARSSLNAAREIGNLARVANTTPEKFQRLSFGAKTVGVDAQKLADIFKDTGDKIGDFIQTGGGPLVDFFENIAPKIGVTADMFRDLSGPDALQLYYDSIDRANLSQSEMTFFMEAIASDATLLTPLLRNGGKGFEDFGKKAEEAGLIMTDLEQEKLERVNLKIDILSKRGTVLAGTFLTKFIPALNILGQGLGFIADVAGVTAATTVGFGKALGGVIAAVVSPAISRIKSLALNIKGLKQVLTGDFSGANESIAASKKAAAESAQEFADIPKKLKAISKELEDLEESAFGVLGESIGKRSKSITDAVDDITGAAKESEDALADVIIATRKAGEAGEDEGGGKGGKGFQLEMEQKIMKLRLDAMKAETRGEEALAKSIRNRVALAERILEIMNKTGATQREATIIANKQIKAELSGGGSSGESTGSSEGNSTGGSTGGRSNQPSDIVRGNIRTGRITSFGLGTRESRFGPTPTMDERERGAGLTLRGNDTMRGRASAGAMGSREGGDSVGVGNAGEQEEGIGEALENQIELLQSIADTLNKLDGALSGD
jgi:hypothetical protein